MEGYVSDWQMSPGILTGDFLFLTGMTAVGADGTVDPDPISQFHLVFERIAAVLKEAGGGFEDVVEMTSYHVGLADHADDFRKVRAQYVKRPYPAWTAIEVAGLMTPGALVEIRVIARKPDERPTLDR